tara:strand:- start:2312 stop:2569 length:258 start_codon:yes stop_codon:yes gene_type:complete
MKRSEMVDIIMNQLALENDYNIGDDNTSDLEVYEQADYLLTLIERAGMLPPNKYVLNWGKNIKKEVYSKQSTWFLSCFEWEDEDG